MKNMLRLLAALALCLLFAAPAMAAQEGYYTYEYSEEWGGAEITGYSGNETNIVVPSKLGGYDVVSFNPPLPNVFGGENNTLTLPQTIRYIGGVPTTLRTLYLPENVEAMGHNAICMVNYPTYVDKDSATAKLIVAERGEVPSMHFIDPDEPDLRLYYVKGENGELELGLYEYLGSSKDVCIPEGIIHYLGASDNFDEHTTLTLPESLKHIEYPPNRLKALYLPENLESVNMDRIFAISGYKTYLDKDSATAKLLINDAGADPTICFIDPDVPNVQMCYVRDEDGKLEMVLYRYYGTEEVIRIPDGYARIYRSAFRIDINGDLHNTTTKKVYLPDSVTALDEYVFLEMDALTEIWLSPNITSLGAQIVNYGADTTVYCDLDSVTARSILRSSTMYSITDPDAPEWSLRSDGMGGMVVKKYQGNDENVVVPDGVTAIDNEVFLGNDTIISLTLPESVTKLGFRSFYDMTALKKVYLSSNITSWGGENFCASDSAYIDGTKVYCSLDSETFRSMPIHPGYGAAFPGIYDANYPDYLWDSDGNGGKAVYKYTGSASKVVIPDGVTAISEKAFHDMPQLTSVTVPDSVTSIGHYAFAFNYDNYDANPGSYQILTIYLPDNITEVGYGNFMPENKRLAVCTYGSKTAEAIDRLNESDEYLWNFYSDPRWPGCLIGKLDGRVYFGGYVGSSSVINVPPVCTAIASDIGSRSPISAPNLSVIIPEGVTRIETRAFGSMPVTSLTLPSTLTSIAAEAFQNLFLENLIIPEGVTKLRANLTISHIKNLYLPASLTSIDDDAFRQNIVHSSEKREIYVENIYCYKGTKAAEWAKSRENQEVIYLDKGEYNIIFPSEFYADVGSDYDWQSMIQIFPEPDIDYTLKISSSDTSVISVKNNELNLKKPGTAKLTVKSSQLDVSKSKTMTVYAPVESFSVPEYIFHQKRTSSNSKTITVKVSKVTPSEGTNPLYYWNGFSADNGGIHTRAEKLTLPRPSIPCAYSLVVASASDVYRQCSLIFYDDVESVKFSAFSGDYYAGDVVTPTISVKIDGTTYKNNRYTYTLTSSDPTVAKVTSKGKLQLLSKGTATIACEALDGTIIKRKITVQDINVYTIPKALQVISSEAFAGCPAQKIVIQDGCQAIGDKAFADCEMLETIVIPASVTGIAPNAFDGCPDGLVIEAPAGSYAASYAEEHGYAK